MRGAPSSAAVTDDVEHVHEWPGRPVRVIATDALATAFINCVEAELEHCKLERHAGSSESSVRTSS